jgi:ABC-type branched-subunit amino acid transport system ATPase component
MKIEFNDDELSLMIKVIVFANQNMLLDELEQPLLPLVVRKFRKALNRVKND